MNRPLDVICMGRAAVDLYADQIGASLEDASSFSKYVGGCPANIAIGSARLGLKSAMLTRVGDEAMGRFVKETLEREGVNTELVKTDPERLTGLVLLGIQPPDHFPLIFYRENCADMAISENDFSREAFSQAKALLVTGTHFSNPEIAAVSTRAVKEAKAAGCQIILDIDFRPVLWKLTGHGDGESRYVASKIVSERLNAILADCDLIVGTDEEIRIAAGKSDVDEAIAVLLKSNACVVEKRGEHGCSVHQKGKPIQVAEGLGIDVLNVLGAGDAFMSGFLRGWLRDEDIGTCCQWANACGAIVVTRHGCSPEIPYWSELQEALENPATVGTSRFDGLHSRLNRRPQVKTPLCLLAFDHRQQMRAYSEDPRKIADFKNLLYQALKKVEEAPCETGIIVDGEYGHAVQAEADTDNCFCASPIEEAQAFPLCFLNAAEAHSILRKWPKHRPVKVLVRVSPHNSEEEENVQWQRLRQLHQACSEWGQALLLELVVPVTVPNGHRWIHQAIQRAYVEGIYPTWWKLPPFPETEMWRGIQDSIKRKDPLCEGILVLGQGEAWDSLAEKMQVLSEQELIRGFAIGRSIWRSPAEAWFNGSMTDEEVVETVAKRYSELINCFCNTPIPA